MKVIFRSNNSFAKKTLGQLGGAEEWLEPLNRYLSQLAVARLSLFIDEGIALANLDIVDGPKHVYSSCKNENILTAVETAIKKSVSQLKKVNNVDFSNETIRDLSEDSIVVNQNLMENFKFLSVESNLEKEKSTSTYQKTMNKYINYLYRENDIETANNHLKMLYAFYSDIDKENTSVADYERLIKSIRQITDELEIMLEEQEHFEHNTKDNAYIDYIIEEEIKLTKLKK